MAERKIPPRLKERARKIKVILMDVDGVMTRGDIVYDSNGLEIKHFNAHDGLGIKMARLAGLKTGLISMRESGTIRKRAGELQIDFLYLGKEKKLSSYLDLKGKMKLADDSFAFIGDDLPDIPILNQVGLAVAVRNASDLTRASAHYITKKAGGDGAVREVVEMILESQDIMQDTLQKLWTE